MEHLIFFSFVIITSWIFALFEIQIEGKFGWAEKVPTWRVENIYTNIFFAKRPLTGYHLFLLLFVFLMIHAPFAFGLAHWYLKSEMRVMSFMMLFWVFEDFLWFANNPSYGITKFRPEFIWWHRKTWWWIMPRDYWIWTPVAVFLYLISL
jgi:hypothetical protein